jgi:molybdate transport system ATP-binding protein
MLLRCRIPLANFTLDIDASFDARVTSIFGPSGSGKTTLLDAIAGLRSIAAGEIEVDGNVLFSSKSGINQPPQQRGIGYVPQEGALFPHLSVRGNIHFGARRKPSDGGTSAITFDHVVEVLEIGALLDRPVTTLSGGEMQRAALARAILSRPRLLLLDEPLAALDIGLKERILPYLRRVRDEFAIPMLYVTHDVSEVFAVADWVIMIRAGKVIEKGAPRAILPSHWLTADPEQSQVENIFDAVWVDANPTAGRTRVRLECGREIFIPFMARPKELSLQVRIRGDDILLATHPPAGISAANVFDGVVLDIEIVEGQAIIKVDAGDIFTVRLTMGAVQALGLGKGRRVFLIIKTRSCVVL